ncbi:MAG: hypothetical protein IIC90_05305 [Chloroflexi bacterium]|nr:hypothetical protein [Chloroflexota bacterium]
MAREAIIRQVNRYDLHGVAYYRLVVSYSDEPDSVQEVRISHDSIYGEPADGDRILVEAILNVVTEVRKKTSE